MWYRWNVDVVATSIKTNYTYKSYKERSVEVVWLDKTHKGLDKDL